MWIYESRGSMTAVALASLLLLLTAVFGRDTWRLLRSVLQAREPRFLLPALGMFVLLGFNVVETRFEHLVTRLIPWDFTQAVTGVGEEWLRLIQRLEWEPLTHLLTYVYVLLFPVLPMASMVTYVVAQDGTALRRLFMTYLAGYAVSLPFFLLFPVKEAWAAQPDIRFLIPEVYQAFEQQYRQFSALDNSFPSMHTALALMGALVAQLHGYRRLGAALWASAGLVMFSTLYLGVHSVLDLVAGAALAAGVAAVTAPRSRREGPAAAPGRR